MSALTRHWNRNHGKHFTKSPEVESHLNHIEEHPLVQKFLDHQMNYSAPPNDYEQIQNMGVWKHPVTGERHIVARDHGFNTEVMGAYKKARENHRNKQLRKFPPNFR